ncbi:hypothetical protein ACFYT4_27175 [Streptomyces sp. NPDC004609]|uniref:hypothetical protein n=1 Tax=Streptomyces sp. NPDC004609 TaxID=3364704 RepID=UPI0036C53DAD
MPPSRDRHRSRAPVAAIALLGMVFAVLLALCPPSSAPALSAAPSGAGSSGNAHVPSSATDSATVSDSVTDSVISATDTDTVVSDSATGSSGASYGDERPVLTAQGQGPGCGKAGQGGDRGAQPSAPPRATAAYEPPPVPWDTHCATDARSRTATGTGTPPDGRPPPLVPPSPEELSILRV